MVHNSFLLAASLTLFAGLATIVGGFLSFYAKRTNTRFLATSLGFSAGVMIYVAMLELMNKARDILTVGLGSATGNWAAVLAFFGGMLSIALIDKFIPSLEDSPGALASGTGGTNNPKLLRMGLLTALAIGVHNFPEGLITFFSSMQDPVMGLSIAAAIAIHNIPEGIAIAAPIYYSTGSRRRTLLWVFLSGVVEPIGALAGYLVLTAFFNSMVYGIIYAAVAGIMVYISFNQLLPAAREYGGHKLSTLGMFGGMAVMALSLLLSG